LFDIHEVPNRRARRGIRYHYCKGLHARYSRNFHEALAELNQARKDPEWGAKVAARPLLSSLSSLSSLSLLSLSLSSLSLLSLPNSANSLPQAIQHMIEIYLDPDSLPPASATLPATGPEPEAVRTARQLRGELLDAKPARLALLEAYELLLGASKASVEAALVKFTEVLTADTNSVSALLGSSHALVLLKQDAKARNHLKRIAKMQYNSEEAEELERSYLLLADIYVQVVQAVPLNEFV
jgi:tetratricopeptide repeat protein 21B